MDTQTIVLITRMLIEGAKLTAAAFSLLDRVRKGEKITADEVETKQGEIDEAIGKWEQITRE